MPSWAIKMTNSVIPRPTSDKMVNATKPIASVFNVFENTHSEQRTYCSMPPARYPKVAASNADMPT